MGHNVIKLSEDKPTILSKTLIISLNSLKFGGETEPSAQILLSSYILNYHTNDLAESSLMATHHN